MVVVVVIIIILFLFIYLLVFTGQYKTLQSILTNNNNDKDDDDLNNNQQHHYASTSSQQQSTTTTSSSILANSCVAPEVLVNGAPSADIAGTVSGGDFSSISEIQFVGVVNGDHNSYNTMMDENNNADGGSGDTLRQKRICKIKCLHGVWIGPLCALQNGQYSME